MTNSTGSVSSKLKLIPCENNFYSVCFSLKKIQALLNIPPFIPSKNDQNLIAQCQQVFTASTRIETLVAPGGILQDVCSHKIFTQISLKDLLNFSQASKCCYLATKADFVWAGQFKKIFPAIQPLSMIETCYSTEQQFKIYFNHFQCTLEVYKETFNQNKIRLNYLFGPHGNDGEIEIARKKYEECGGQAANTRFMNALIDARGLEADAIISNTSSAHRAWRAYFNLTHSFNQLAGPAYDGTDGSIESMSQQGRLLQAIYTLIPSAFNDQVKFEACIKKSEALRREAFFT